MYLSSFSNCDSGLKEWWYLLDTILLVKEWYFNPFHIGYTYKLQIFFTLFTFSIDKMSRFRPSLGPNFAILKEIYTAQLPKSDLSEIYVILESHKLIVFPLVELVFLCQILTENYYSYWYLTSFPALLWSSYLAMGW